MFIRNEKGLSLVEVLASIALLTLIGTLLFNILTSSKKQYTTQLNESANLSELSLIAKNMTTDFRKSNTFTILGEKVKLSQSEYVYTKNIVSRNTIPYSTQLKTYCVLNTKKTTVQTSDCAKLTIPLFNDQQGIYIYLENNDGKKVESTIYSRGN